MKKTSYKGLTESKREFEDVLAGLDLEINRGSWLQHAYHLVGTFANVYEDDSERKSFMQNGVRARDLHYAFYDLTLLKDIIPYLQTVEVVTLKKKLKLVLRMESLSLENLNNNEARNTLWELYFYSRLQAAKVKAILGNPNPDILAMIGSRKYYIQCKRLYSLPQNSLNRNIIKVVKQLINDLASGGSNAQGVLAFSVERPLIKGNTMLAAQSEESLKQKLRSIVEEFRKQYGYLWQDPEIIKDPRIIAIAVHVLIPAMVADQNIFVTGSQMDINNTWSDGQGFQRFARDFGSLSQSFIS